MGSAVKSVEKTISKIIPNEVKPVLPYLAVAAPWLGAAGYLGAGLEGLTPFQSALFGAGTNLASQVATGQAAKHGINPVTLALSGAGGYLTAPGTASQLEAAKIIGDTSSGNAVTLGDVISTDPTKIGSETLAQAGLPSTLPNDVSVGNISNLQSLENVGTQGLASLSSRAAPTLNQSILSMHTGAQLAPGIVLTASEQARIAAQDALDAYNAQQSGIGNLASQNKTDTISYVTQNMKLAGFSDTAIQNALAQLNLGGSGISQSAATQYAINQPLNYPGYSLPSNIQKTPVSITDVLAQSKSPSSVLGYGAADGGIMGYAKGGKVKHAERLGYMFGNFVDPAKAQAQAQANQNEIESTYRGYLDRGPISPTVNSLKTQLANKYRNKGDLQKQYTNYLTTAGFKPEQITGILGGAQSLKKGGKANKQESDMIDLHGHEMDYRAAGGFVPIGKKERADDVPARLSKNEFVFTAKAVRNAGGGDIKEGAKRMYHIMKQLEARS